MHFFTKETPASLLSNLISAYGVYLMHNKAFVSHSHSLIDKIKLGGVNEQVHRNAYESIYIYLYGCVVRTGIYIYAYIYIYIYILKL